MSDFIIVTNISNILTSYRRNMLVYFFKIYNLDSLSYKYHGSNVVLSDVVIKLKREHNKKYSLVIPELNLQNKVMEWCKENFMDEWNVEPYVIIKNSLRYNSEAKMIITNSEIDVTGFKLKWL